VKDAETDVEEMEMPMDDSTDKLYFELEKVVADLKEKMRARK